MNTNRLKKVTGWAFILGAILVNVPYGLLIANFNYPDILREPTGAILTEFSNQGFGLIFSWLAFAWCGLPILFGILWLPRVFPPISTGFLSASTALGGMGAVAQMIGLLRWVFVVPGLARLYTDPAATPVGKDTVGVVFQIVHQYGGVLLGEHIGQAFTILWMGLVSIGILRQAVLPRWIGIFGLVSASIYLLAQGELLATVIPAFPQVDIAGLIGSLMWLVWMVFLGVGLVRDGRNE